MSRAFSGRVALLAVVHFWRRGARRNVQGDFRWTIQEVRVSLLSLLSGLFDAIYFSYTLG